MTPRSPFRRDRPQAVIRAAASAVDVLLYDEIGYFGISAKDLIPQLRAITADTIHLRINSPGGDVFDGVAIYNALRDHPATVITHVDALAASIASLIALAGSEVRMAANAMLMIHEPWGLTIGNAADHRKTADLLDKIGTVTLVDTYVARTGQSEAEIRALMADETWLTAEEALALGFADAVDPAVDVRAEFDLSVFRHAPPALAAQAADPTVRTLEQALRDAGLSRAAAKAVLAEGYKAGTSDHHALLRDAEGAVVQGLERLTTILRS